MVVCQYRACHIVLRSDICLPAEGPGVVRADSACSNPTAWPDSCKHRHCRSWAECSVCGEASDLAPDSGGKTGLRVLTFEKWCPGADLNHRHADFQSAALPLSYPGIGDLPPEQLRVPAAAPRQGPIMLLTGYRQVANTCPVTIPGSFRKNPAGAAEPIPALERFTD